MAEEKLLRKILVVADGSSESINACKFAITMAKQYGVALYATYVVDTATLEQLLKSHIFVADEKEEYEKDIEMNGQRHLEYIKLMAVENDVDIKTSLLKGSIHSSIIAEAKSIGADAIVIGGWKDTRTRMDLAAKERQYILDTAPCSVIIVK